MPTTLASLVDVRALMQLHDARNRDWHVEPPAAAAAATTLPGLVEALHAANFTLWHAEDEARRPGASDAAIAAVKRQIDRVNQLRNDTAEAIDAFLLAALGAEAGERGEQHSETPGMMIDRLSILSLKLFHTHEELSRPGAPEGHRERNAGRLAILKRQRDDLGACLERLWEEICEGRRYFRRYHQLKMYNDPELNPVLYEKTQKTAEPGA